jgi:hypothetical protein
VILPKKVYIIKENKETPEEIFYDYALEDIPMSVLSEAVPIVPENARKSEKFVSLRDVLVERGNFWQDKDKNKKVENIWEQNPNMPAEEMIIDSNMLVGDVLPTIQ